MSPAIGSWVGHPPLVSLRSQPGLREGGPAFCRVKAVPLVSEFLGAEGGKP